MEALKKNHWICEHSHTSLGPPPTVSALGYFFLRRFLDYWGCVVRCETDFVPFLKIFDQNNAKQRGRRTAKIWQIKGERVDFDGQINHKIYEVLP